MVDQGLWDRPNHIQGADHTHLESRDLPNYTVSAEVIGFGVLYRASIWARVPFYGETLQQEKGTRPKNEPTYQFPHKCGILDRQWFSFWTNNFDKGQFCVLFWIERECNFVSLEEMKATLYNFCHCCKLKLYSGKSSSHFSWTL